MDTIIQQNEGVDVTTTHAVVELTAYRQQHGTLPTPMPTDMSDQEILQGVAEMLRAGDIVGIDADPAADLTGFQVTRFNAKDEQPNRVLIRPEAKFG